jgi:hypothetical protein
MLPRPEGRLGALSLTPPKDFFTHTPRVMGFAVYVRPWTLDKPIRLPALGPSFQGQFSAPGTPSLREDDQRPPPSSANAGHIAFR